MPETLLTQSSIKLFGRVLSDLTYTDDTGPSVLGFNNFLQSQLAGGQVVTLTGNATANSATVSVSTSTAGLSPGMTVYATSNSNAVFATGATVNSVALNSFTLTNANSVSITATAVTITATGAPSRANLANPANPANPAKPQFARIYAFSFEGALYSMPRPAIFLVHGPGLALDLTVGNPGGGGGGGGNPNFVNRTTMDQSGVIAREWEFTNSSNSDLRYWEYEKGDFSIRLDPDAGPFEQILLAAALRAGADMADRATPISGAGLGVRSGAGLSGAGVSGAGLSGAGLSGAGLSGAGLRGR